MPKKTQKEIISEIMSKFGSIMTPKKKAHLQKINDAKKTHDHEFGEGKKCIHCDKYKSQFGKRFK
jgi:hypothetical protein